MKKLIYSFAAVLLGLVSCTTFDDPTTENYGAGPSVDVTITPGAQTDSAFTITITPAAGSLYYAYVIDANDEAEQLDSATLYKGGYGNTVVKVADQPTTTIEITDADPNTTYQVYAVAGSEKGIIGKITVKSITTTDKFQPGPQTIARDADNATVKLNFSEAIQRGEGAVTARYYKEWDITNPVDVPAEDITVEVSGNAATFAAANIPAGAYLCFSYAAGAFTDLKGNPCNALNSGLNMNTGKFTGAYVHVTNQPFDIDDSYVAPVSGTPIGDWEAFRGTVTFPYDIFRNDETVEKGDVQVVYVNDNREVAYNLDANQWAVEGNKLTFVLPTEPAIGDMILFYIAEGAIADVYGNVNNEYSSAEIELEYVGFIATKDMLLGTFDFTYLSAYDEEPQPYNGGPVTISENPEKENSLIIKGLFSDLVEGSELDGSYDLEMGKFYVDAYQILGNYTNSKGTTYGLVLYSQTNEDLIEFTINSDGTITSTDLGIVAYDETYENAIGWFEKATIAALSPKTDAAARSMKTWKQAASKAKKLAVRARSLKKQVRK